MAQELGDNNNQSNKPKIPKTKSQFTKNNQQIRSHNNRNGTIIWSNNAMATMGVEYNTVAQRLLFRREILTNTDGTQNSYKNPQDLTNDDAKSDPNDEIEQTRRRAFMTMEVAKYLIINNPNGQWINYHNQKMYLGEFENIIAEMEEWIDEGADESNFDKIIKEWSTSIGHISVAYGGAHRDSYFRTTCDVLPAKNAYKQRWIKDFEGIYIIFIACISNISHTPCINRNYL